jgi:hypothetical protein
MDARSVDEIEFLVRAGLDAGFVVVDLGSGTGQFAWRSPRVVAA